MTTRDLIDRVLARSADDPVFRATALHDPAAALAAVAREHDLTIRGDQAEAVVFIRDPDDHPSAADPDADDMRAVYVLPRPPDDP
jgi:hypothetical protein